MWIFGPKKGAPVLLRRATFRQSFQASGEVPGEKLTLPEYLVQIRR
jgi:hypothetical protein